MATREDVHREFGAAAEIAQAMEHDLGKVLIAHKGLEERVYLFDEQWEPDSAYLEAVRRNTLGTSLRQIRQHYNLVGQFEPLDTAIAARNYLIHRFFIDHLNEMETESGCSAMCARLQEFQRQLWSGHELARGMADFMVAQFERLLRDHHDCQ